MKIDIKHSTIEQGLMKKSSLHVVTLLVEFTEEEKAIIKQNDIGELVIIERDPPATTRNSNSDHNLTFNMLFKGEDKYVVLIPSEAKAYTEQLIDSLKKSKEFLEENATLPEDISLEI